MRRHPFTAATAAVLLIASAATAAPAVVLPGISYEVLASGAATGAHPTRGDTVAMRYVGRLETGEVFSTSPGDGKEASNFPVNAVIPGMGAALQLMRVGDHWRITMPPYLAYGPGRAFTPPAPAPAAGQASGAASGPAASVTQKRGIPPNATLVFDVELTAILPPRTP